MAYIQKIPFDITKGGTVKNYCLDNVRKGYGIANKYASAWEAWQHSQQHTDDIPAGLSVPVFFSYFATIDGQYRNWGHIGVQLSDGTFWSDGVIYSSIRAYTASHAPKYVGWGESVNDYQIIKEVNMAQKVVLSTARIFAERILGRDFGKTHSGEYDSDLLANHVGRDLTNEYVMWLWQSPESVAAGAAKDAQKAFYDKYVNLIGELESRPTKAQLDEIVTKLNAEAKKVEQAEAKAKEAEAKADALEQDKAESMKVGERFLQWIGSLFKKG